MKSVIFASLLASAAAFAPSSQTAQSSTALNLNLRNEIGAQAPLGYFDFNMLSQASLNGVESAALFAATALAMEYCFDKQFISKFK